MVQRSSELSEVQSSEERSLHQPQTGGMDGESAAVVGRGSSSTFGNAGDVVGCSGFSNHSFCSHNPKDPDHRIGLGGVYPELFTLGRFQTNYMWCKQAVHF